MTEDVPKVIDVIAGQSASGITRALDRDGQLLRFSLLQAPPASIGVANVNNATGEYTFAAGTINGDGSFLIGVSDGNAMISVPLGIAVLGGTYPMREVRRLKKLL